MKAAKVGTLCLAVQIITWGTVFLVCDNWTQNCWYPDFTEIEVAVLRARNLRHHWSHFPSNKQVIAVHSKTPEVHFCTDLCLEGELLCILWHLINYSFTVFFCILHMLQREWRATKRKININLTSQSAKGIALRRSPCSLWGKHQPPPMKDMSMAGVCMQQG